MTEKEVTTQGLPILDSYLGQLARKLNKTVQAVETTREQCEAFNSMPDSLAINIINGTLNYQENIRNGSDLPKFYDKEDLVQEYLCGYSRSTSFQDQLGGLQLSTETIDQIGKCSTCLS